MKRSLKSVLIILATYTGLLVVAEFVGQLYIHHQESKRPTGIAGDSLISDKEPLIGFGLRKNMEHNYGGLIIRTNSLGFRGHELPVEKPADEYRIFVVGGSTVFGWGEHEQNSIPAKLEQLLKKEVQVGSPMKYRVINAGIPWYTSSQEAALIYFRILDLNPDAIIVLDGLNDVVTSLSAHWAPNYLGYADTPTQIAYERRSQKPNANLILLEFLKLSPTLQYLYAKAKARRVATEGDYHPEMWNQYISIFDRVNRLAQSMGIDFSVFLQPVMVVDYQPNPYEEHTNRGDNRLPKIRATFEKTYLEGEKRLLGQRNFRFASLKSIFRDSPLTETCYIDGIHYTEQAHQAIAEAIFDKAIRPGLPHRQHRFSKNP